MSSANPVINAVMHLTSSFPTPIRRHHFCDKRQQRISVNPLVGYAKMALMFLTVGELRVWQMHSAKLEWLQDFSEDIPPRTTQPLTSWIY
jgi:hypothetical protein